MERIIEVKINGQFSSKSSKCAGRGKCDIPEDNL